MPDVDRVFTTLGVAPVIVWRALATILVLAGWLLALRLSRRVFGRTLEDAGSRFQMLRITSYATGITSLIILLRIWAAGLAGLGTYLGLLSAGIAVALGDPLTNFAGWMFIILRRPFRIGDRIQIGAQTGDVVDIRVFRFVMLEIGNWVHADQSTGRVLHVPNGFIFKHPVANYDEAFGFIWNELEVTVTFESDWRKAKLLLLEILELRTRTIEPEARKRIQEMSETLHIKFTKLTPVVWTSVADSGVRLTMRYLCKPRERRSSSTAIWEAVLDAFGQAPDIDLAYPTMRRFDNVTEGKPTVRAAEEEVPRGSRLPSEPMPVAEPDD